MSSSAVVWADYDVMMGMEYGVCSMDRAGQKNQNSKVNIFEGWMSLTYMSKALT